MTSDERRTTNDEQSFAKADLRPSSSVFRPVSLSVAIIAKDEQRHIGAALASVAGLAGEVIVLLDSRTSDRTAAISHEHGAQVIIEAWRGFAAQRNRALDLCLGDWVLFLDADERVTPELRSEILGMGDWGRDSPNPQSPIPHRGLLDPAPQPVFRQNAARRRLVPRSPAAAAAALAGALR